MASGFLLVFVVDFIPLFRKNFRISLLAGADGCCRGWKLTLFGLVWEALPLSWEVEVGFLYLRKIIIIING